MPVFMQCRSAPLPFTRGRPFCNFL
ncbi:hypothetical protein CBM2615_A70008 [Cupriavidus taiwanensis]|uniref:Uncharacterized protein n=1 Tax=Cupriavidus taiwanensis TaxID=164546 RepID=A0A976AYB6_9BURK|nr:hypothetical protein CBM2615_A70008 [Cupriavidus taiwanensis]SOZ60225.1 hypothetical protein CBM2614_A60135 [Cupriavidus taiwanensis]SOZ63903.1 hypothetical protein CBM2613_A50137 [Cupriavidus taiwanensis]SPA06600.1 hypothetical protein CBM2625_A60105 [Cupriavidus taiwanensis]